MGLGVVTTGSAAALSQDDFGFGCPRLGYWLVPGAPGLRNPATRRSLCQHRRRMLRGFDGQRPRFVDTQPRGGAKLPGAAQHSPKARDSERNQTARHLGVDLGGWRGQPLPAPAAWKLWICVAGQWYVARLLRTAGDRRLPNGHFRNSEAEGEGVHLCISTSAKFRLPAKLPSQNRASWMAIRAPDLPSLDSRLVVHMHLSHTSHANLQCRTS